MRMSAEEKEKSHARIVESAARLFRERGLEGASVADVMKDAGMTHGGFYKHFDSKEALIEAALASAFSEFVSRLSQDDAEEALAAFRTLYLSRDHMTHPAMGCPVAALGTEVARGSALLKRSFGAGVRRVIDALAAGRRESVAARRAAALREFSQLVGAMVIARASDPELAAEVLAACGPENRSVRQRKQGG